MAWHRLLFTPHLDSSYCAIRGLKPDAGEGGTAVRSPHHHRRLGGWFGPEKSVPFGGWQQNVLPPLRM